MVRACCIALNSAAENKLTPLPPPLSPQPARAVRKSNIDAAEKAMWEEELALHALETPVAENAVLRQRNVDWKFRSDTAGHAHAMMEQLYPFVAKVRAERGSRRHMRAYSQI